LMLDGEAWDKVVDRLVSEDFYHKQHRIIYEAIARLARKDQPFDSVTLAEDLKAQHQLENCGGEVYLFEIANSTPSAANVTAYADIVRERALLRQLVSIGTNMIEMGYDPKDQEAKTILDRIESMIFKVAENRQVTQGPEGLGAILTRTTDQIDVLCQNKGEVTGLKSGFIDLDKMTSGLQPSDLVIVAARPSMGKTVLGMNIAEHAAINGDKPVVVFSLEMTNEALGMRLIASLGRINQQRLRSGNLNDDDWPRLTSAVSMLSEAPMFIDDTPGLTAIEMRARSRRVARRHGPLGLIVVDYLQLMQGSGQRENRTLEISEISRMLKLLAKEMECPVVALSQLNRSLEQRQDKRPVMSDLRESGAIEQDADVIVFIYRDEVYNPDSVDKGTAELIIAKQRNGPIGRVRMAFVGEFTRFDNLAQEQTFEPLD
jgi:replicative DNA helicase